MMMITTKLQVITQHVYVSCDLPHRVSFVAVEPSKDIIYFPFRLSAHHKHANHGQEILCIVRQVHTECPSKTSDSSNAPSKLKFEATWQAKFSLADEDGGVVHFGGSSDGKIRRSSPAS